MKYFLFQIFLDQWMVITLFATFTIFIIRFKKCKRPSKLQVYFLNNLEESSYLKRRKEYTNSCGEFLFNFSPIVSNETIKMMMAYP